MTNASWTEDFEARLRQHLTFLYPDHDPAQLADRIRPVLEETDLTSTDALWSEEDTLLITYGDSIRASAETPLKTLLEFLNTRLDKEISTVHILPFCPFSSDDGFAVIDYLEVNPDLGDWNDISAVGERYKLMADLVINHVSSESDWFKNYCEGKSPGSDYFVEACATDDLSAVVRPRTTPLLRPTQTKDGVKHLWCTFSHDQIDLNFRNPDVLIEFLRVVVAYLEKGVRWIRLDAVGFLWKEPGTTSLHLPQTHEAVRLFRTVLDQFAPGTILLTETNVPNHENLSYFGNRNEAHMIYNFSLAPLLVHALLAGNSAYLKQWMMSMPPAPLCCTYLNFTASHDGIGMRPAEGLLSEEEQIQMVETVQQFGGRVSTRRGAGGSEHIYELNISLFDALRGTFEGEDEYQVERFLCSQTVMMAVEGIPAFYIHSLLATPNDLEGIERTGHNRSINRHKWDYELLTKQLDDPTSKHAIVFNELKRRIALRQGQPAFHPNATQFTLQLSDCFFAFWRQSKDRSQSIFVVSNLTSIPQELPLQELNLIALDDWCDALSGQRIEDRSGSIRVEPYQCLWITNRLPSVAD
ncbi:MAG: sugar phosphorylase [Planctomycetaceae bacterium]